MKSHYYRDSGDVVMIHKGLSVKICGCLVEIKRSEESKEARVVVDTGGRTSLDALDFEAVKAQANLLRERAQRFFGAGWKVYPWDGKGVPGKVAVVAESSQESKQGRVAMSKNETAVKAVYPDARIVFLPDSGMFKVYRKEGECFISLSSSWESQSMAWHEAAELLRERVESLPRI